jgi:FKBP-type peptidyl-prolyl cis-trans isomerase
MSFIVPTEKFACDAVFPEEFAAMALAPELKLSVRVLSVLDSANFHEHKKELALWKKTKEEYEQYQIKQYLKKHRVKFVKLKSGIYKRILKQGRGKNPKFGDLIAITYQGSLLNGEIINHFTTLDFSYGTQMQVIEGIELAIKTMRKGERAQIIVPSKYAWGEEGASDGAIAPYSPIIFDIELKKITRQ